MLVFWILVGIVVLFAILSCIGIGAFYEDIGWIKTITYISIVILIAGSILTASLLWLNKTESGKRMQKSWESEVGGGIERRVRVYGVTGELLEEYCGKFDVDADTQRILFGDENGKRHQIFYPNGIVIVDEK